MQHQTQFTHVQKRKNCLYKEKYEGYFSDLESSTAQITKKISKPPEGCRTRLLQKSEDVIGDDIDEVTSLPHVMLTSKDILIPPER